MTKRSGSKQAHSPRPDASAHPCPVGALIAAAAEAATDVLLLAEDEGEAAAWRMLASAFAPDAQVVLMPAPELDAAGSTGATAARRIEAARALGAEGRPRAILVATAEAAFAPVPADEGAAFPSLAPGDALEGRALSELLEQLGYYSDERVDEPGEYAIRGQVIDIFSPSAERPVRIDLEDGRIASLRHFDPVTQLGAEDVGRIYLLPLHPEVPADRTAAALLVNAAVGAQGKLPASARALAPLTVPEANAGMRFVEQRQAARAFASAVKRARAEGDRVVLAGTARDLRFLAARARRTGGDVPESVDSWKAVKAASPGAFLSLEAPLDAGWRAPGLMAVAAADLLGARAGDGTSGQSVSFEFAATIRQGDVVIDEEHGLGVVRGLEPLETGGEVQDALKLEHARGGVRLVPVTDMDRLWRYGAEPEAVTLDRLDGSGWAERRRGIDEAIAENARALVRLVAERETRTAPVIDPPRDAYERFAGGFGHALTAGQREAIDAVERDFSSGHPMDRLVVGDVGYGKTEVALRAAALAVLAGYQVAVAAPTTVLVRQHLETFRRRFAPMGVRVEGLSRLSTAAEAREVKAGLADGSVAIVIGTQAIAGEGVSFKSLALVVLDEEQRFGAADKVRLRTLAPEGHVLTLTATPIPRTLQSALTGLQELSLITSPPARRQPIGTEVMTWDADRVASAIRREKARGGQSFVVVPQIADMEERAAELARIAPELTVVQAHGRMGAAAIDDAMVGFADGQGDVLLATNIIEAGLDVPRANTMVVWRADRFGLSQLHQLRGRVGRGGRRGAIVLTTEEGHEVAPATLKRLRTLEAFDRLGAGFEISARDLDLRGAGDLLGEEQAGHMELVGVDLYQHLFALAVRAARGEVMEDWHPELNLGLSGRLPEAWLPDEDLRIEFYGRLVRAADDGAIDRLVQEMEDRFGPLPDAAAVMIEVTRLRLRARQVGVSRLDLGPAAIALTPYGKPDWTGSDHGLVEKDGRWLLRERIEDGHERLARAAALLDELAGTEGE